VRRRLHLDRHLGRAAIHGSERKRCGRRGRPVDHIDHHDLDDLHQWQLVPVERVLWDRRRCCGLEQFGLRRRRELSRRFGLRRHERVGRIVERHRRLSRSRFDDIGLRQWRRRAGLLGFLPAESRRVLDVVRDRQHVSPRVSA
jgi:hypothetical protein